MKESYSESIASYTGPESYADGGNTVGVATAGVYAGKLLSSEITIPCDDIGVVSALEGI